MRSRGNAYVRIACLDVRAGARGRQHAAGRRTRVAGASSRPASIPLASILPQGVAGCTLRVNLHVLDLYVPTAGSVQTQLSSLPRSVRRICAEALIRRA